MSLELKIEQLTASIERLIAVMSTDNTADTATDNTDNTATDTADAGEPTKRKRRTKAEMEAAKAAESAPAGDTIQQTAQTYRYFNLTAQNTVLEVRPGELIPTKDAVEITKEQYDATRAAQTPVTAAPAPAPVAIPAPPPVVAAVAAQATDGVTKESLLDKCKALHAAGGNDALKVILDKFMTVNVPGLLNQVDKYSAINFELDAALKPAASPALFG